MVKLNTAGKKALKRETEILSKDSRFAPVYELVSMIVSYLKENDLSAGYSHGAAVGSVYNYNLGLTKIDPTEHNLIFERFFCANAYSFSVLLDKASFDKTQAFLKTKNISKRKLKDLDIEIKYDRRIDRISKHKRVSGKELSKLAMKMRTPGFYFFPHDFNYFCDLHALRTFPALQDFWFDHLASTDFISLAAKLPLLRPHNSFGLILYQEEWMQIVKKITGLPFKKVNTLRRNVGKRIAKEGREFESIIIQNLKKKYEISEEDAKKITYFLCSSLVYLPCKAHVVSDAYIEVLANED